MGEVTHEYPLVVSFYTQDWEYPRHAAELKSDCARLGIEHRVEELQSKGRFTANCCMKPEFIRQKLIEEKRAVLWVDVDSRILKPLSWFRNTDHLYDLQARHTIKEHGRRTKWHVVVMWWNYTPEVLAFMDRWIDRTYKTMAEGGSEEAALEWVRREGHNLRVRDMPWEYSDFGNPKTADPAIRNSISKGASKKKEMPGLIDYELRMPEA
jgi:hypothetical protein